MFLKRIYLLLLTTLVRFIIGSLFLKFTKEKRNMGGRRSSRPGRRSTVASDYNDEDYESDDYESEYDSEIDSDYYDDDESDDGYQRGRRSSRFAPGR